VVAALAQLSGEARADRSAAAGDEDVHGVVSLNGPVSMAVGAGAPTATCS
jgi:hypothetical protein